jgi:pimeloyl-ACP methyl ester carboxylesterase
MVGQDGGVVGSEQRITHVESIQVVTADGVRLAGVHVTPMHLGGLAFVLCHGFTVSTRRPAVRRIAARLGRRGGVLAVDFRGHGRSGGLSTVGDLEVLDVDAVVGLARRLGYPRVATVGFSMGGAVVVRHAAGAPTASGIVPAEPVDAVVSVSAPSRWYIRDTRPMRRVHWLLESRTGRLVSTGLLRTRLGRWDPAPESPVEVAGRIPPTPLLVVHGDRDEFLGVEHGRALVTAAGADAELWEVPGFGHAEGAATPALVDRIADWVAAATRPAGTMRP